jgi:hypothetical protein
VRQSATVLVLAFLLALAVPGAGTAEGGPSAPFRFVGTYEYVGGNAEIDEMDRAIDEAVEQLNVFIRGIARRRLQEANRPTETLTIAASDREITITRSGKPEITAPADGTAVAWKNPENGNQLEVSHGVTRKGVLSQRIEGDRGTSENRFVLDDAAGRLSVETTILVDRVDDPIRFETTYVPIPR